MVFHVCEIRVSPALNIRTSLRLRAGIWDSGPQGSAVGAATYFFKLMSDQLNAEECNIRRFCAHLLLGASPFASMRVRGCNVECNNCTGKPLWCQCINPYVPRPQPPSSVYSDSSFSFPPFCLEISQEHVPFSRSRLGYEFSKIRTAWLFVEAAPSWQGFY